MNLDSSVLTPTSLLGYLLVFFGGVITSIGPCNAAMIPLIIGYIGGAANLPRRQAFAISLVFAFGLSITFMILGIIASLIGGLFGGSTHIWYYLVAVICIIIGLQILGVFHINPPYWVASLREKIKTKGLFGALILGLISGLAASQCATPVLAAILTYVMARKESLVYGAFLLLIYALGRGVPIVLAGTFAGALKSIRAMGKWSDVFEKASGVVIILVGLYFVWMA
ncbi:MAG TPA: cytochrome c biogenesis CcdA family protein [Pelolinea sp.]|nr:cytochrome c biogenesis CcdA family protein [Pelolinea sp.]